MNLILHHTGNRAKTSPRLHRLWASLFLTINLRAIGRPSALSVRPVWERRRQTSVIGPHLLTLHSVPVGAPGLLAWVFRWANFIARQPRARRRFQRIGPSAISGVSPEDGSLVCALSSVISSFPGLTRFRIVRHRSGTCILSGPCISTVQGLCVFKRLVSG
ncbi:hypothetical protein MPH_02082 [Macrophomina phaseolina MS6]|uniref:Uncharacterized protein n=1 Tax=Macrophomina phaseolina (strain MS6) TaxID=1126212 RepID=K2SVE1_MACPH|nr:hypothetical protein MPH_02082 [Macrophomina phaseolina MS6]